MDQIVNHSRVELKDKNKCALCHKQTITFNPKLPNYYCNGCFARIEALGGVGSKWSNYLIAQENTRRKKRDRLMKGGVSFHNIPFSALKPTDAERLGV